MISLALLLGLFATESLPVAGKTVVGQPAPWFAGWDAQDRVLNRDLLIKRNAGAKVFALVIFQTTCKPCEKGLSMIREQRAALEREGIRVVLVAMREDAAKVKPWLSARGLQRELLLFDRFGVASKALGVTSKGDGNSAVLPHTVVMDSKKVVRAIFGKEDADYVDVIRAAALR